MNTTTRRPSVLDREELRAEFKRRNAPFTVQRLAVYEELAGRLDHPSAEALYESLSGRYPSLSLATVYKTLETLRDMGLAIQVDSPTSRARYDACVLPHHHVVCAGCGRIDDVYDKALDRLPVPSVRGFVVTGFSVVFRGSCAGCAGARRAGRKTRGSRKEES